MHIVVLTLYPSMFPGPLGEGVLAKARTDKHWTLSLVNMRDFAHDTHKSVDAPAFGGGAGMVMMPHVVDDALTHAGRLVSHPRYIYLSPRGRTLTQAWIKKAVRPVQPSPHEGSGAAPPKPRPLVLLCGRFEGVDQRVLDHHSVEEVSLGDFVLMGGEVAAMALIESVVRLLPGVLGNASSLTEESFEDGLLEYPHYTRPRVWQGREVPQVLLSGHHERIQVWRQQEREHITQKMRPDLWDRWTKRVKCGREEGV
ncbi:tRNA (guanine(37)-N(1))-methyltransferase [Candidatus Hepatobacter penaei]|uniref:tRNA (guanine(37)-N(1))-methyltransferase n=1 Tax=Candidatus Hepatobacter penaei TaxID=1274402 RepID=UPI0004F37501|nr:tRNA (guanine(37)-N(1))-methyltransferase [Candidatus Hepatobacter penaei]